MVVPSVVRCGWLVGGGAVSCRVSAVFVVSGFGLGVGGRACLVASPPLPRNTDTESILAYFWGSLWLTGLRIKKSLGLCETLWGSLWLLGSLAEGLISY